jgi:hypothetical protein
MNPLILTVDLCGEFLCTREASQDVLVKHGRGHVLHLCEAHAQQLAENAAREGLGDRLEFRRRGS